MNKMFSVPALALLMAAGTAAQACPDCADKAAQAAAATPAEPSADALRVVIDKETGKLRAPTAAEIKAADKAAAAQSAGKVAQAPLVTRHANGARRVRVTEEFQSHSVAVVRADGTVETQCYDSKSAAMQALKTAQAARPAAKAELE